MRAFYNLKIEVFFGMNISEFCGNSFNFYLLLQHATIQVPMGMCYLEKNSTWNALYALVIGKFFPQLY